MNSSMIVYVCFVLFPFCVCVSFFSCGSYFWLHFLKREQKQTFPWYCLLTKTKLSFLYVFILFFRDLQITMVNFFFLLFAFLPQFLDAMPYNSAFLSFAMKRVLSEREFYFFCVFVFFFRLNAKQKSQTTFTNSRSCTWRRAQQFIFFSWFHCRVYMQNSTTTQSL